MIIHHANQSHLSSNPLASNISNASSSVVLFGKDDESRFLKDMEEKSRVERIKQVREQEKEASKKLIQMRQEKMEKTRQQEEEEQRYQEYLRKKQEIDELKKLKEIELERAGKAMRDAQEQEERALRVELEKKEKALRDNRSAKHRGNLALEKERLLLEEQRALEEQIRQIERKKLVMLQESELAHEQASKFREQESMKSKMSSQQQSVMEKVSKFGNKTDHSSVISKGQQLDYTNTRFHTTLIVRHDTEQAIAEECQKGAFDMAKVEATKKSIKQAQKENVNFQQQVRAKSRGREALSTEISKKDRALYENEMKRLQVQEGLSKIKQGAASKGSDVKAVVNEKKSKEKKQKLESMFEEEFIRNGKTPSATALNVPKPKASTRASTKGGSSLATNTQQISIEQRVGEPTQHQQERIQLTFPTIQYSQGEMFGSGDSYAYHTTTDLIRKQEPEIKMKVELDSSPTYQHHPSEALDSYAKKPQLEQSKAMANVEVPAKRVPHERREANQQESSTNGFDTLQSKFFVPLPNQYPTLAKAGNALPQHNPFIQEIQNREEEHKIAIHLNHPKEQRYEPLRKKSPQKTGGFVDEFLQENMQFLDQSQTDSEVPSDSEDYYDEESSSNQSSCSSAKHSSQLASSHHSGHSSYQESHHNSNNAYPINHLNKNNEVQANKVFSYSQQPDNFQASPGLSDKYLNSQSHYDHSQLSESHSVATSGLADEFLQMSDSKPRRVNQQPYQSYGSSSLSDSDSSMSMDQLSYLKSSAPQQQQTYKSSVLTEENKRQGQKVFDYSQSQPSNQLKHTSKNGIHTGGADVQTPQSELSYSYSEMLNEFDGSNYGSSKMKMSGMNLTKNLPAQGTMTMGSNVFAHTYTIHEDAEENKSSSQSYSQSESDYSYQKRTSPLRQNPASQKAGNGGVKIEIGLEENTSGSLADAFRQKKLQILQSRDLDSNSSMASKEPKRGKTKEELAEIRRQMMKPKSKVTSSNSESSVTSSQQQTLANHPKDKLMSRLAKGEKTEVSKKDMLKLTSKNYELLPEVMKKKEEERKKQVMKDRMKQAKDLERQRRELLSKSKR